jgi:glycine/D-amino acid oxidase-like deaminating enzyme
MGRRSVVVVGAGVFGAWSAWRLAREGWRVTLVEPYGPANARASSSDHSRVIRAGYGAQVTYAEWATASLASWHLLARRSGEPLVVECGALFLGAAGEQHLAATEATVRAGGVTTERGEPGALAAR